MVYFETEDQKTEEEIWRCYDKTLENVKRDIETINNWLNSQPHLPYTLTDRQIKIFLMRNKGSVEKTKSKINMYHSMRTMFPELFLDSSPFSERAIQGANILSVVPLPKLCRDLTRGIFLRMKGCSSEDFDPIACFVHYVNILDIRLFEDISLGSTIIFDLDRCKFGYVTKTTPALVNKIQTVFYKALTSTQNNFHLINAPGFADQILSLMKSIIKPKLANRMMVHRNLNSLLEVVDKDVLPKDYGGNERPLDELEELFYQKFEEYRDFFKERDQWKMNENVQPWKNINDDWFGCYGNFRELNID